MSGVVATEVRLPKLEGFVTGMPASIHGIGLCPEGAERRPDSLSRDRRQDGFGSALILCDITSASLRRPFEMAPRLDDDCSCAGRFQTGVLDEVVLIFDDVAIWPGAVQEG